MVDYLNSGHRIQDSVNDFFVHFCSGSQAIIQNPNRGQPFKNQTCLVLVFRSPLYCTIICLVLDQSNTRQGLGECVICAILIPFLSYCLKIEPLSSIQLFFLWKIEYYSLVSGIKMIMDCPKQSLKAALVPTHPPTYTSIHPSIHPPKVSEI